MFSPTLVRELSIRSTDGMLEEMYQHSSIRNGRRDISELMLHLQSSLRYGS